MESHSNDPPVQDQGSSPDLVLVVFIHGFKGTDSTFAAFPERLQHILSETIQNVLVECVVFPAYETKGDLSEAVIRFADWLTTLTVQREVANGLGGGAGKASIVLCGHSMGGLLAADAVIEFVQTRPDQSAPLWPRIVSCIALDTPYLGLHPHVFKNSATQVVSYAQSARSAFSSFQSFASKQTTTTATRAAIGPESSGASASVSAWQKWAPAAYAVGGAVIAGAAAGAAYYKRDDLGAGYKWATDHMKYVGNLWDEHTLHKRLERLLAIEEQMGVLFKTFYTLLPPKPPSYPSSRTFIVVPREPPQLVQHFSQAANTIAADEIQAHTGMFDSKTNDGYYELGLVIAQVIQDAVAISRRAVSGGGEVETQSEGNTTGAMDDKATELPSVNVSSDDTEDLLL
ncbi:uncharacterized protein FIBRA_06208 [Fibroporia radiculosa]|uniref:DUF676 domain-containing protein n=1 Tax=Fibroporia radiculosa TaxID=599839 RepID=J4H3Y4_9APHY|nr:uncharacterized protein FIBRA_06208 [Fibroporia radiculosa]CCM04049.1 predicted protein [Fibroporia radiculosa]